MLPTQHVFMLKMFGCVRHMYHGQPAAGSESDGDNKSEDQAALDAMVDDALAEGELALPWRC